MSNKNEGFTKKLESKTHPALFSHLSSAWFEKDKAKVIIALVVSNVLVAFTLIGIEAALIDSVSDIKQSVDTVSNIQTAFNKLGLQLYSTAGNEDKIAATALIVIGSLTIAVNLILLILYCIFWIYGKKVVAKIQLIVKASFIITGCILILLLIPGSVYLDNIQSLQASKINQTTLQESLQVGYKDDSFSSPGNAVSNAWNEIFIEFQCCGVNSAMDFYWTPWCLTSGSCQQAIARIPKTCCKGVDKTTYTSAPRACYERAISGFNKQTGGISLILLVPKAIYTHRIGTEIDWSQIKQLNEANMLQKLHSEYKNDIISQYRNTSSDRWNLFFLTHKCCAVHSVQSTTNDFDLTFWCTTSGSCQQTNSQIPKACCKNVTADNYTLADSQCHAFVSPETYYEKGCASIWTENPYISPLKAARGSMYKYQISAAAFEFVSEGISLLTIILTYFWQL